MANPQILEYIKSARAANVSEEEIKKALRTVGWPEQEIQDAFSQDAEQPVPPLPPRVPEEEPLELGGSATSFRIAAAMPFKPLLSLSKRARLVMAGTAAAVVVLVGGAFAYSEILAKPPEKIMRLAVERFLALTTYEYQGTFTFTISDAAGDSSFFQQSPIGLQPSQIPGIIAPQQRVLFGLSSHMLQSVFSSVYAQNARMYEGQPQRDLVAAPNVPAAQARGGSSSAEETVVRLDFSGKEDKTADQEKSSFHGTVTLELPRSFRPELMDGGSMTLTVDAVTFQNGKRTFVKFGNLELSQNMEEAILAGQSVAQEMNQALDTWILIDEEKANEYLRELDSEVEISASDTITLTPEEQTRLANAFLAMLVLKELKGEKIDGVNTYHYGVTLMQGGFEALVREAVTIYGGKNGVADWNDLLEEDSFKDILTQLVESFGAEIWIGKKDLSVRKATYHFAVTTNEDYTYTDPISFAGEGSFLLSHFNEPVTLSEPQDAVPLEALIESWVGNAQRRARDSRRIGDLGGTIAALELYYDFYGDYPNFTSTSLDANFDNMVALLRAEGLLGSAPTDPLPGAGGDYQYLSAVTYGELSVAGSHCPPNASYVIRAYLEQDQINGPEDRDGNCIFAAGEARIDCGEVPAANNDNRPSYCVWQR